MCLACTKHLCTLCDFNTVSDQSVGGDPTHCVCAPEFIADTIPGVDTKWCTTCTVAVIQTYLTPDYKSIKIEFPTPVHTKNFIGVTDEYNTEFCEFFL